MTQPTVVDGIIKDWGERLFYEPLRGRKGRNIRSGRSPKPAPKPKPLGPATREKIARVAKKSAEVMVKISGGGKNMKHIKAHLDYISRNGKVELEDEQGDILLGTDKVRELRDLWAKGGVGIPYEGEGRREAFNIVLSMPPGTDRDAVRDAAREFAAIEFGRHQYVFAAHNDEQHPHVHLAVKAVSLDGDRLNPRKADLQAWRALFAERLRAHGIEANATPRKARGIVQRAELQSVRHINADFEHGKRRSPARVTSAQRQQATHEAAGVRKHINPARRRLTAARKDVNASYGHIARALAAGDALDQQLALQIVGFVASMPPVKTRHELLVERIASASSPQPTQAERGQEPEQRQTGQKGRAKPGREKGR